MAMLGAQRKEKELRLYQEAMDIPTAQDAVGVTKSRLLVSVRTAFSFAH
jgi:hypothetical protein